MARQTATATAEYVAHTRSMAEAEGDRRSKLLDLLLLGYDESDGRAATLLRRSGYVEQRQSYCVIVAQPVEVAEMQNPARAQRLQDALTKAVNKLSVRSLVTVRDNEAVAVISRTRRLSGWTAQQSDLASEVLGPLRRFGNAIILGVSNDAPSTSYIPRAYQEASLALDHASVANRVSLYRDVSLRDMMLHAARDRLGAALPGWAHSFSEANDRSRGKLAMTLRAYADANMNVQQAAKALSAHPNTIYARFQKIQDQTGKNPLSFHDLNELLLSLGP
jgi:sugar diacid utilization regulator